MNLADKILEDLLTLEILWQFFGLCDSWGVPAHFPVGEDLEIHFSWAPAVAREQLRLGL